MSDGTKIEWTDATWNVVNGCSVVSPGCKRCYAMKQAHRFPVRQGLTQRSAGGMVWIGEVRFNEAVLFHPLRWRRPRRIFVCAHGDLFHEKVPDEWIDRVFAVMALSPQHAFQVLTKRPKRMRDYCNDQATPERVYDLVCDMALTGHANVILIAPGIDEMEAPKGTRVRLGVWPPPNVWLGVSVEDQQRADERIPVLLDTPAAVRWLSMEPLLGPVDLRRIREGGRAVGYLDALTGCFSDPDAGQHEEDEGAWVNVLGGATIDWIVLGGESGPGARPMHPDWARSIRDQCAAVGVPFLFKQWGEWVGAPLAPLDFRGPSAFLDGGFMARVGKRAAGRLLDGVQHDGYPG